MKGFVEEIKERRTHAGKPLEIYKIGSTVLYANGKVPKNGSS